MKFKIRKRWIIFFAIFLLISPFLVTCTMSNEDHQKLAEFRLKPVLQIGTNEQDIKQYLDTKKFNYHERVENYCSDPKEKYEYYKKLGGTQKCENVPTIYVRFKTRFTMIEGSVLVRLYLDKDKKLEAVHSTNGWTFL